MKLLLHCDEELFNIEFCTNLGHQNSLICSQAVMCLLCKNLWSNVIS